jgi:hypothetical protein
MGCDGGSIPKRQELVKEKQKQQQPDKQIQRITQWTRCTLSKTELREPVVADRLGKLYNRESVLEYLLDATKYGDADILCPHLRNLKDVVTLRLTPNPTQQHTTLQSKVKEERVDAKYMCPISGKEMNGKIKFLVVWTCGCVLAQEALDQVPSSKCLVCAKEYSPEDLIILNPTGEDEDKAKEALQNWMDSKPKKKKRKAEVPALLSNSDEERKKKQSKINMDLPDLSSALTKKHSKAVASLFQKDTEREQKQNFLTRGMFNRYVAH